MKDDSQRIWWHICETAQAQRQSQVLQKSHQANAQRQTKINRKQQDRKEGRSAHIGFAKWRVQCFYDSLVQGSSSVFQMNICVKNPPLRKAANRYNTPFSKV